MRKQIGTNRNTKVETYIDLRIQIQCTFSLTNDYFFEDFLEGFADLPDLLPTVDVGGPPVVAATVGFSAVPVPASP